MANAIISLISEIFGGLVDLVQRVLLDPFALLILVITGFIGIWVLAEMTERRIEN